MPYQTNSQLRLRRSMRPGLRSSGVIWAGLRCGCFAKCILKSSKNIASWRGKCAPRPVPSRDRHEACCDYSAVMWMMAATTKPVGAPMAMPKNRQAAQVIGILLSKIRHRDGQSAESTSPLWPMRHHDGAEGWANAQGLAACPSSLTTFAIARPKRGSSIPEHDRTGRNRSGRAAVCRSHMPPPRRIDVNTTVHARA
jgi:hypothetical protein